MKVTSVFLFKKISNNIINEIKNKVLNKVIYILFFLIITVILSVILLKNSNVLKGVYKIGTNLRQAEEKQDTVGMLLSYYPMYNTKNYLKVTKNLENKKENINENYDHIFAKEYNIIDSVIKEKEVIKTMSKLDNMNLSVTDNNKMQTISFFNNMLLNYSSNRKINIENMLKKNISLTKLSDKILIYNTHTSESYANSENFKFSYTGTYRSMDANYNVLKVAKEFESSLKQRNFSVYHDTTPHDYGTYTSAYAKSRITAKNAIDNHEGYGVVIDLHRDALGDLTKGVYTEVNGVKVAQLMFVMGVGTDTSKNPYWEENLSLAIQLQKLANQYYPGLFRAMIIRNSLYNQDINKNSLLLEVGTTGNTLDEAILATRCFANVLNEFYLN